MKMASATRLFVVAIICSFALTVALATSVSSAPFTYSASSAPSPVKEDVGLTRWWLEDGRLRTKGAASDRPLPVGSLMKPFVVKAWARAHPGEAPPRHRCEGGVSCWRPSGHGDLGLAGALAVSCNAYFRALAADTPARDLAAALVDEGFTLRASPSPEAAIGLDGADGPLVRPRALLEAYVRLTREPWPVGEDVRTQVLAGLRDSATRGTARGLGRRGYWAKTGTVPALDGVPLRTSGWALAVDDAGSPVLGLLARGTGREAATALGSALAREDRMVAPLGPEASAVDVVRVALLGALSPRAIVVRNVGAAPVAGSRGYVGPGGQLALLPKDRLADGSWEIEVPRYGFRRRVRGGLACTAAPNGTLRLVLSTPRDEYVAGVLAAELDRPDPETRVALGAAVLRFLDDGPRHADATVCDQTHCAWFVGRGPRLLWPAPDRAEPVRLDTRQAADDAGGLAPELWSRIQDLARMPGPARWTAHCGGAPLSAHAVWGNGDRRIWSCPRHQGRPGPVWRRRWSADALARAFGGPVSAVEVAGRDGVWQLRVSTPAGSRDLGFDDAHRALARVSGWDSLPSPALRVVRAGADFEAEGVGSGHRVGLCLGE
jgi:stage II sporulation protein D